MCCLTLCDFWRANPQSTDFRQQHKHPHRLTSIPSDITAPLAHTSSSLDAVDMSHMRRALELAEAVCYFTSPRPWVGCVVVASDGSVFEGATDGTEGSHAEQAAVAEAGDEARGATLYTTLEPCVHYGKTPPCTDAIIKTGVSRVVIAVGDPDEKVSGRGGAVLREAGIEVEIGVCRSEAEELLAPYLTHRTLGRPHVTLKLAATLDGRTAMPDGSSQWITGEEARADAHLLRAQSDAVMVGAGTARRDNPSLTVRDARLPSHVRLEQVQPKRFVLGEIPQGSRLLESDPAKGISPAEELRGDISDILADLAKQDILSVLLEGGSSTAAAFHEAKLIDRYVFYLAPALAGGTQGAPVLAGETVPNIADVWRGQIRSVKKIGDDLRIDLKPL